MTTEIEPLIRLRDDEADLCCPHCGSTYLHHANVEVFERREDADTGFHAVVGGGSVGLDTDLKGNPSGRRGGVLIHFYCEECPKEPTLAIAQHKGQTFIYWVEAAITTDIPQGGWAISDSTWHYFYDDVALCDPDVYRRFPEEALQAKPSPQGYICAVCLENVQLADSITGKA